MTKEIEKLTTQRSMLASNSQKRGNRMDMQRIMSHSEMTGAHPLPGPQGLTSMQQMQMQMQMQSMAMNNPNLTEQQKLEMQQQIAKQLYEQATAQLQSQRMGNNPTGYEYDGNEYAEGGMTTNHVMNGITIYKYIYPYNVNLLPTHIYCDSAIYYNILNEKHIYRW